MKRKSVFHEKSELVGLFNSRFQELGLGNAKPYHKPAEAPEERVVRAYAEANRSDPFAEKRIRHYLKQGYVLASDITR
jgi:hypothetical protein